MRFKVAFVFICVYIFFKSYWLATNLKHCFQREREINLMWFDRVTPQWSVKKESRLQLTTYILLFLLFFFSFEILRILLSIAHTVTISRSCNEISTGPHFLRLKTFEKKSSFSLASSNPSILTQKIKLFSFLIWNLIFI